jgi:hypothetical protein
MKPDGSKLEFLGSSNNNTWGLGLTEDGSVIGSTATIGHAAAQVRALFDRSVLQFPPPGFDASDSFFAVRDAGGPDRLYIGIPTAGRSPKFALQAVIAALLQSAATLVETGKADDRSIDAYWTCIAYFNSLRELGGAYVLMQDDVPRQMQFLSGRLGSARRMLELEPEELSSRKSSRELPGLLRAMRHPAIRLRLQFVIDVQGDDRITAQQTGGFMQQHGGVQPAAERNRDRPGRKLKRRERRSQDRFNRVP